MTMTPVSRLLAVARPPHHPDAGRSGYAARSRERYRRIAMGASVAVGSRAATVISVLVSVPLVLHTYGTQQFAIWATLTQMLFLLAFSDLGLSHGLVNLLGDTQARNDRRQAIRYVSSAFALLGVVVVGLGALFAVMYPSIDWGDVFQVRSASAVREAGPATLAFAVCFLLSIFFGVAQNVRLAYQESAAAYSWITAGSVLGLVLLVVVVTAHGPLSLAVAATFGGPVIAALLNSIVLFGRKRPWLLPRPRFVSRFAAGRLLRTGAAFVVLQASAAVAYQSDAIVIAQVRGVEDVTRYMIPWRMFALLPTIVLLVLIPFWPAFRSAILTGDVEWASRALRRCIAIGLATVLPLASLLVVFAGPLVGLWTGTTQQPSSGLLVGLAAWAVLSAVVTPLWTFLISAGALRPLAIMAVTMALVNVPLSVVLTSRIGIQGAIFGTVIAQAAFLLVPGALYTRKLLRRLARSSAAPTPRPAHSTAAL